MAYHKPFRVVAGVHGPPPPGQQRIGNDSVRLQLGVVPVEWEIALARLAFAPNVSAAPPYVLVLVTEASEDHDVPKKVLLCPVNTAGTACGGQSDRHRPHAR